MMTRTRRSPSPRSRPAKNREVHMAKIKILFLTALSFFLFAASYRLLAVQPAHAQTGQITAFWSEPGNCQLAFVVGRTFYFGSLQQTGSTTPFQATIPGAAEPIATGYCSSSPTHG